MPIIAVPDAEYSEIARRVYELEHKKSITLLSSSKEPIRFYKTDAGIRAVRTIDGKKVRSQVEPLSKIMKQMPSMTPEQEREQLKQILQQDNPTWNNARLELEIDLIYEKRKSVKTIMEATGCKAEEACRVLERGIADMEAQKMMKENGQEIITTPTVTEEKEL